MTSHRAGRLGIPLAVLALAMVGSACSAGGDGSDSGGDRATDPAAGSEPAAPSSGGSPSGDPAPTGSAKARTATADLADRLGVDPGEITLISEEQVTWRDGSLGCPEPGMFYTQALVPGTRIVLEADGTRYEYHSGSGDPVFCKDPRPPLPDDGS